MTNDPTLELIRTGVVPGAWPGDQLAKEGLESARLPAAATAEVLAKGPSAEIVLSDGRQCELAQEAPARR